MRSPAELDAERDEDVARWNEALAKGDPVEIERVRVEVLNRLNTRIWEG